MITKFYSSSSKNEEVKYTIKKSNNNKTYLSDEGRDILEKMKNGEMEGTFYVNFIEEESDQTELETKILVYKK